jgi:hypothetical protein
MADRKAAEPCQRTTRSSPLAAAPHLAVVGTAGHLSLPLLDILARVSLAVALREATETQTDGLGQDAVGKAERRPSASPPDVGASVVSFRRKRFARRGTTRYGPSRPGGVRTPPYRVDGERPRRPAGDGGRVLDGHG